MFASDAKRSPGKADVARRQRRRSMAFLSHVGRHASRFQFDVLVQGVERLPRAAAAAARAFYCSIERGKKRFRTRTVFLGETHALV
jgi:hypothetical protein